MIERLIAFDTTSRNSNLELIHYVRDYLKDLGVAAELVHDGEGRKANLYATLGPTDRPGIALSAIGRASCRERVCQYVSISVVAGSLTKKKEIISNAIDRTQYITTINKP